MVNDSDGLRARTEVLEKTGVRDRKLLDIGAGPLAMIAAKDFNCHVTSIDIDHEKLRREREEAVREGIRNISFERGDATDLSYRDNEFDVVISYAALHHIPPHKRKEMIHEIYRVAREKIIIADYTPTRFKEVHPDGEYTAVNHVWLEKELKSMGEIEKYPGKEMNTFVCLKSDK